MSDPANVYALDDIRTITGREVQPVVATSADVEQAIQKFAGLDSQVEQLAAEAAEGTEGESSTSRPPSRTPIVKLVNAIMTQAVAERASDVHIEPGERDVRIRFRVDGVLHEPMRPQQEPPGRVDLPAEGHGRSEHRGEARTAGRPDLDEGRHPAARHACRDIPTVHGEKVVIRVLDKSNAMLTLADLGFLEDSYDRFATAFSKPYGAIS